MHPWNITPKEAIGIQERLRGSVITKDEFRKIETIAGADISLSKFGSFGFVGIILYKYPDLVELERVLVKSGVEFPYIPGLLSFREAPLLIRAFKKLKRRPDIFVLDGQGRAHPRRFGLACHVGLLLNVPTIGCAKSRLIGTYREPAKKEGSYSYLNDKGEVIGAVFRSKMGVRPVFISIGHKVSLDSSIKIIADCIGKYRIPIPTREADIFVRRRSNGFF